MANSTGFINGPMAQQLAVVGSERAMTLQRKRQVLLANLMKLQVLLAEHASCSVGKPSLEKGYDFVWRKSIKLRKSSQSWFLSCCLTAAYQAWRPGAEQGGFQQKAFALVWEVQAVLCYLRQVPRSWRWRLLARGQQSQTCSSSAGRPTVRLWRQVQKRCA